MPIFCVKSVKIYTGQKKFTRAPLVALVTNIRYAEITKQLPSCPLGSPIVATQQLPMYGNREQHFSSSGFNVVFVKSFPLGTLSTKESPKMFLLSEQNKIFLLQFVVLSLCNPFTPQSKNFLACFCCIISMHRCALMQIRAT